MLSELFEFDVKEPWEYPWESEARESVLEEIIREKYNESEGNKVLDVAKNVIKLCRKIGGTPKIREYASRAHGTINIVCYMGDVGKINSIWFDSNVLGINTDKGVGDLILPKDFGIDINVAGDLHPERINYSKGIIDYFKAENYAEGVMKPEKISVDIYEGNIQIVFK